MPFTTKLTITNILLILILTGYMKGPGYALMRVVKYK